MINARSLKWVGHIARTEEDGSTFKILTGKLAGKRPLGRPRRRWEENGIISLKIKGVNTRNWFDWAQDRDYWTALGNNRTTVKRQF